jgi:hypothetical protein
MFICISLNMSSVKKSYPTYHIKRRHNPQGHNIHLHRHENLKSLELYTLITDAVFHGMCAFLYDGHFLINSI